MGGEKELISAGCTGYVGIEPGGATAVGGAEWILNL